MFYRIHRLWVAAVASAYEVAADIGKLADEDRVEGIAVARSARIARAAGQSLQRRAQRGKVFVVVDVGSGILKESSERYPVRRPDFKEKSEGYQCLPLEQIDIEQSRAVLRVDEKQARVRFARQDRDS